MAAMDPITGGENLATAIAGIVGKFIPDPAAKAQADAETRAALQQWDASQNAVNAAEAASTNPFTSAWRPFIGWVCGAALAYQYVAAPIAIWIGFVVGHPMPKPPTLDDTLWQLMFAMLGMGGLRTYEKLRGVQGNH
jgi:hypothetical protein